MEIIKDQKILVREIPDGIPDFTLSPQELKKLPTVAVDSLGLYEYYVKQDIAMNKHYGLEVEFTVEQMRQMWDDCKGLTVKSIKNYKGHGGEPLQQFSIWNNGKKFAFFSEGDWGGPEILTMEGEGRYHTEDVNIDGKVHNYGQFISFIRHLAELKRNKMIK